MLLIHIRSLPLAQDTDIARVLEGISKEFAEAVAISVDHIHLTWEYLLPGYYVHQGRAAGLQEDYTHPIQVDIAIPDKYSATRAELIMNKIAEAICRRVHVPFENILVVYRDIKSGFLFNHGLMQSW
jgi:hypothetical protein